MKTKMHAGIETAFFQLEDSYKELVNYCEKVEADPQRLYWINERLSRIQHFVRKFSLPDAEGLHTLHEDSLKEYDSMQHLGDDQQRVAEKIASLTKQLQKLAEELSGERHKHVKKLDRAVVDELRQLGMNKAVFETRIVSSSLDEDKNACRNRDSIFST